MSIDNFFSRTSCSICINSTANIIMPFKPRELAVDEIKQLVLDFDASCSASLKDAIHNIFKLVKTL